MRRPSGFTLIEIAISVAILLMLLLLAVPSVSGVLADRRLRHSLDEFNKLVQQAQERSVLEHRAYLISWEKERVVLGPETPAKDEGPVAVFKLARGEAIQLNLTAALTKDAPPEWIFWPSGNCEPATIAYKGVSGSWTANYSPLTARADVTNYAAR
jgi:prepilin-type N-terminal cleavage/methylation domain-containing protein